MLQAAHKQGPMRIQINEMNWLGRPYMHDTHNDVYVLTKVGAFREGERLPHTYNTHNVRSVLRALLDNVMRGTHGSHLGRAHVERFGLVPACRLDLDVVSWPAALPRCCLFRPKPISRQLALRVHVRKVGPGLTSERRETRDKVAQFARPVVGPKVIQSTDEYFVYLFREKKVIFRRSVRYDRSEDTTYEVFAHDSNQVRLFRGHGGVEVTHRRPDRPS